MDINTPGKDGVQTTIEIKTDYPHLKVIGLSVDSVP
jgi:DNA-binding NarL/FixJ family response regulator